MSKRKITIHIISILLIMMAFNFLQIMNFVYANTDTNEKKTETRSTLNSAYIYSTGDCGSLLKYKGTTVKVSYVEYKDEGISYPAFCLDKTKPGAETNPYTVTVQDRINDVKLWKVLINGYPYKTIEQLGVANKEEAFTATKQAIYCCIHGNNPQDYEPIGEAGIRTLNALNNILDNAKNSTQTQISNTITINRLSEKWEQDKIEKDYISKTYSVSAQGKIESYKIEIENELDIEGIKITDENNKEKQEFTEGENFKVLIPIKNITRDAKIKIQVESTIETKPVLYGKSPDSSYQDYALTTATYENGTGYINEQYQKNETKIVIIKQDAQTKEKLENVEFELLNENKDVIYSNLKTDKEGKIILENLIPQKYYIKETKTLDGYEAYEDLIEVDINLNEELTVTVNNSKEEEPTIEKISKEKEVRKLPVTGM